jgi:hypothetical protein
MPERVTYTFDVVSVTTLRLSTTAGEAAARSAARALNSLTLNGLPEDIECGTGDDVPEDTEYRVTCVSPRGPVYLVDAETASGQSVNVSSTEICDEPIPGHLR